VSELHRIEGPARELVHELSGALSLGERLRPRYLPAVFEGPAPDMLLEVIPETAALSADVREAALRLLVHVLGREGAPSSEDLGALAGRVARARRSVVAELEAKAGPLPPLDGEASGPLAELLHEIGLDRLDLEVYRVRDPEAGEALVAEPVASETAHVLLLGRLFQRIEALLMSLPLLALERIGSAWWFAAHSAPPSREPDLSHGVREREWSLFDRATLALRRSMADAYAATSLCREGPARLRRMAQASCASFAGGFVVRERTADSVVVVEEMLRRRRIEVHEHSPEAAYEPGWIAIGRLYAFDRSLHLRSPGMVFLPPAEGLAEIIAKGFAGGGAVPAPLFIEMFLAKLSGVGKLPVPVPPAASPQEANDLLVALTDALEEQGLAEDVPREEGSPEMARAAKRSGLGDVTYRRYQVDWPIEAWMKALMEQSRRAPAREKGRKGKERRGKRRR